MHNGVKVGVGYITCRREKNMPLLFKNFDNSYVDERVIVNDTGTPYKKESYPDGWEIIEHKKNISVGVSKNDALKYLMDKNCSWIFLIEDDIIVKDMNVFKTYIDLAEKSGIRHLNYSLHGDANKKDGKPNPRSCIEYTDTIKMSLNCHCVGAFSLYHKEDLEKIGLMDELFVNAWEHCEWTYRHIKAGLHPAFWLFADVMNSDRFFEEIGTVTNDSVIRKDKAFKDEIAEGRKYFNAKHGVDILAIPDANKSEVFKYLEQMENK